jgi:hypothetical protein
MTKNIVLRKFNSLGEKKFEDFFDKKIKNKSLAIPFKYLNSDDLTEKVNNDEIKIDLNKKFTNAFEFGKYIYNNLKEVENFKLNKTT